MLTHSLTLLRVEAVNLRFVIDDTQKLPVRRSGGLMLLQAIDDIQSHFHDRMEPISTGASVGLFKVSDPNSEQLVQDIQAFLANTEQPYAHATFVVKHATGSDFTTVNEALITAIRWQQMQMPSFSTRWGSSPWICEMDKVRPAGQSIFLANGHTARVSAAVKQRWHDGQKLRSNFYRKMAVNPNYSYTQDTDSLSTLPITNHPSAPQIPKNLNGKMAVFYVDGNNFGKIQRACKTPEALKRWDETIKGLRKQLLGHLLDWLKSAETAQGVAADSPLPFETLLWGGDECLFLLPAWYALEFTKKFFEYTADWNYNGTPLRHAVGLVFVKHSAPIGPMQKLAKNLADNGKSTAALKKHNTLSWVVLESFDHVGNSMQAYWSSRGIPTQGWERLLLTPERLATLCAVQTLKPMLPRSALVRVLKALSTPNGAAMMPLIQRSYLHAVRDCSDSEKAIWKQLWQSCGSAWEEAPERWDENWAAREAVVWTLLLELWDYLPTTA